LGPRVPQVALNAERAFASDLIEIPFADARSATSARGNAAIDRRKSVKEGILCA
jgi:hypothetical protein